MSEEKNLKETNIQELNSFYAEGEKIKEIKKTSEEKIKNKMEKIREINKKIKELQIEKQEILKEI